MIHVSIKYLLVESLSHSPFLAPDKALKIDSSHKSLIFFGTNCKCWRHYGHEDVRIIRDLCRPNAIWAHLW